MKSVAIALLVIANSAAVVARAQVVIGTAAAGDPTGAADRKPPANPQSAEAHWKDPLSQWGTLEFRPGISVDFSHASGLRAPNGALVSTDISTYAADFVFKRADIWLGDYSAAWTNYSSAGFRDTASHYFRLNYRLTRSDWMANAEQTYRVTDQTLVETGRQTRQQAATTHGAVSVRLGRALMFTATGDQQLTFTESLADIYEWAIQPMLNYAPAKDLSVGVGSSFGYVLVYRASDIVYAKPVGTVSWHISKRTSIDSDFGFDEWKLIAGSKKTLSAFHYRVQFRAEPTESTTLSVSAERLTMAAPFHDEIGESKRESVRLRQRFFRHFDFILSSTIEDVRYRREVADGQVAREDRMRTCDATLTTTVRNRFRLSLLCRFTKNRSNAGSMSFSSRQIGAQFSFHY